MSPEERALEIAKLDHADFRAEAMERLRYQVEFAQSGLRSLTLVNGGAIIALFTFIGNASSASAVHLDTVWLWMAFTAFTVGLTFTVVAAIAAFFSQYYYTTVANYQLWNKQEEMFGGSKKYDEKTIFARGKTVEHVGFVACGLALIGFVIGAAFALIGVIP